MSTRKERSIDGFHKQDQSISWGGSLVTFSGEKLTKRHIDGDSSCTKWENIRLTKDWASGSGIPWWRSLNEVLDAA
jgi:hypothetical protein